MRSSWATTSLQHRGKNRELNRECISLTKHTHAEFVCLHKNESRTTVKAMRLSRHVKRMSGRVLWWTIPKVVLFEKEEPIYWLPSQRLLDRLCSVMYKMLSASNPSFSATKPFNFLLKTKKTWFKRLDWPDDLGCFSHHFSLSLQSCSNSLKQRLPLMVWEKTLQENMIVNWVRKLLSQTSLTN